jgi:hypothetical protein
MYKKIISRLKATMDSFVPGKLSVIRKTASRLLDRTNRHLLFELLILIGLLSSAGIAASRWSTTTIASHGNLRIDGVGVYDNRDCSIATAYLDWGTLEPGSTRNITLYMRNEGNHQATIFMTAENWNPVNASSYMQLGWNYGGQILNPMEVVEVALTLSVSPTVENILDFSFDVMIGINE